MLIENYLILVMIIDSPLKCYTVWSTTLSKQSTTLLKSKNWSNSKFRIEKILWLKQEQFDVLLFSYSFYIVL